MIRLEATTQAIDITPSDALGKTITTGLFGLLVFSTLAYGTVEPWSVAVFGGMVALFWVLWAARCVQRKRLTFTAPLAFLPLLGLIVLGGLQSLALTDESGRRIAISMDVEATRLALEVLAVLLLAGLLAAKFLARLERLTLLRNFLVTFGLVLAVFGLLQHFTWNGKYYWVFAPINPPLSPFGPFVNHNHFAGYLELIIPIPVAFILLRAVYGELSLYYGFAAVVMSVAVFLSLSRGGMISLISGLVFVIGFGLKPAFERMRGYHGKAGALSRIGAVIVILLTIGVGVWWIGADMVLDRMQHTDFISTGEKPRDGQEDFFKSRGWIWRDTVAMIRANWVTGVGVGAFPTAFSHYSQDDGSSLISQAHNDYLQIVADGGLVGAGLALWFLVIVGRDFARSLRQRDDARVAMALGCGGGVFALLVHSLFDFNLQLPSNAFLFLVLVAVLARLSAAADDGRVSPVLLTRTGFGGRAASKWEV
ncbi:MAG: O-antigen ligase family protein [Acidobacteria bacterium]|nr:O-antigen ligase family protein [Acidobacteriota bacterium]